MIYTAIGQDHLRRYVDQFNADDVEDIVNLIPNAGSADWMAENVPLLDCPDELLQKIYYYRWWTFRKHIKQTPAGLVVTEFITPVRHAGPNNTISCATGFHLAEGRWIRDQRIINEYTRYWFFGNEGKPDPKFHNYSSWFATACYERFLVSGDARFLTELLDEFIADYTQWEAEKLLPSGQFWQYDVRDGMEESITGSRTHKNARPTINTYMYANARSIAAIAKLAKHDELVPTFLQHAEQIKQLVLSTLWDENARFFKAQYQENGLSDAREAIGYVPWCFNLPDPNAGYEAAWAQLIDPQGFWAPKGITTAERRHPKFRSHGVGKCEWDGACWPFATSQTLNALANVLRHYPQEYVGRSQYFEALRVYAACHHWGDKPYIGEYHDELNGAWLKGDNPRSRYYNHSTYCDLLINGLIGLIPRDDNILELDPLLPEGQWDWFCLDRVLYHGKSLTIVWDKDGSHYGQVAGLQLFADDKLIAKLDQLQHVQISLGGSEIAS